MTLDIIITHYKEPEEVVKPLLDSIEIQRNVNWNDVHVYLINDGDDCVLSDTFLKKYTYPIDYIIEERRGVSYARNIGFNKGNGDYVMFCDCDDMFFTVTALFTILNNDDSVDIFKSSIIQESKVKSTEKKIYIELNEDDIIHIHGKAYKRKFLLDNNIKFDEDLNINEDGYFNYLAFNLEPNIKTLETPIYIWQNNPNSVTRSVKNFEIETYTKMLDSTDKLANELFNRNKKKESSLFAMQGIYDLYFSMNNSCWFEEENKEFLASTKERFKRFFKKYKPFYDRMTEEARTSMYNACRKKARVKTFKTENILFDDWLSEMLK